MSPGRGDDLGDALDALAQHVVGHHERLWHRRLLVADREQAVVRDDDEGVDLARQLRDALLRLLAALGALEAERPRDDGDRERVEVLRELRDERRAAGAGAAAHAGGDEHHVGALERVLELFAGLLGGSAADLRVAAGAEPARDLLADANAGLGAAAEERLSVGVDADELHAGHA